MPILGQLGMMGAGALLGNAMGISQDRRQYNQNVKNQNLQIRGQKEMTDYQMKKQLEMWEKTNYNAQKIQMQKAGLNPGLMYGMGGGGGVTANVGAGNVGHGAAPSAGGEPTAVMGMGLQMGMLQAQIENTKALTDKIKAETPNVGLTGENIKADTANKGLQGELLKTENELKKVDLTVGQNTVWERVNEILSRSIEQQERGIQAGIQTEIQQRTIEDNVNKIKAEAINTGLQGVAIQKGIQLTEEQTRKIGQDIIQKWAEINQTGAKNEWEHHDRLKAIEEYTENALKVAGIVAAGNVVRDVLQVATRRIPKGSTTETYRDGKGTTITDTQYR